MKMKTGVMYAAFDMPRRKPGCAPYNGRFVLSPLLFRLRDDQPRPEVDLRDCTMPMIGDGHDCDRSPCRCPSVTVALEELRRLGLAEEVDGEWVRTSLGKRVNAGLVVFEGDRAVERRARFLKREGGW
jgi:hypothetical protein